MALRLRSEGPADAPAIAEVTRRAFTWDDGKVEKGMIDAFRASAEFRPDWSVVAELDGQVVGHVLVAPTRLQGDEDRPERPRRALLLGPMSVVPEAQRQGVGSRLMREVLSRVQGSGEALVVLMGHSAFYPRFGFRPAHEFGMRPDWDAAMVYPLQPDLSVYAGLEVPH